MWETIKQILNKTEGTCIIIEDGKPAYVVSKFDEYQKMLENQPALRLDFESKSNATEQELLEKINQEIINWKTKQAENEPELDLAEEEDLKVENLPVM